MRLNGKTAVVTGGASGIGEAVVRTLVKEGAAVVFLDVTEARGKEIAAELGARARFYHGSVAEEKDCAACVALAEQAFGPVSILVNCAAMFLFRSVEATTEEWQKILGVNVIGSSLIVRETVESMKKAGGGSIVLTSSISGFIAQGATMTYNTTKAAILGMARCMALDLGPHKIRVNCVCPGYTMTPAFYYYLDQSGRSRGDVEKELAKETMLDRLATPQDIANCVAFLCSDDSSYVTGTSLMIDGGLTAR